MGTVKLGIATMGTVIGTVKNASSGATIGTIELLMDHSGYRYWDAQLMGGPCKRFYLVDPCDMYGGIAQNRAVAWIMAEAEVAKS